MKEVSDNVLKIHLMPQIILEKFTFIFYIQGMFCLLLSKVNEYTFFSSIWDITLVTSFSVFLFTHRTL